MPFALGLGLKNRTSSRFVLALVLTCFASFGIAQGFPAKPVTVVVPFPPGGSADFLARVLADPLAERWGKPLLVANRPGAGTVIGTEAVAKSPADGHSLLVNAASFVINPAVRSSLPYDIIKDFAPVTLLVYSPQVFVVHSSSAVQTLQDLLAATTSTTSSPTTTKSRLSSPQASCARSRPPRAGASSSSRTSRR